MNTVELSKSVHDFVVDFRRDLHRHPELSMQEFRTTDRIEEELQKLGLETRRMEPTGVIADIKGGKPGKMVALRADIDALPVTEDSAIDFMSENVGCMHACGHDTHAAMLMGAAKALVANKEEIAGTIRLIFQPAEETCKGAKAIIAQGALEGVDMIFGLHIFAQMPVGLVASAPGALLAASHTFKFKVLGKASHGAMPERGVDATVAASAVVLNLQSIVSREIAPTETVVVTVGKLHSGTAFNIVSGEAAVEGTVRYFNRELGEELPQIIERIVRETAKAYRCEIDFDYDRLVDVVINEDEATEILMNAARKVVPNPELVQEFGRVMGSEDFAEYGRYTKAAFAGIGGGGQYPQHNEHFFIEEDAFSTGVAVYMQSALDALDRLNG